MAYAQKIIDRIGLEAWDAYKVRARDYFASQTGAEITDAGRKAEDDPVFSWDDVGKDGPQSPDTPQVYWELSPNSPEIAVVTSWRGKTFSSVIPYRESAAKPSSEPKDVAPVDTGFVDAMSGTQVQPPVDTGFVPGEPIHEDLAEQPVKPPLE